MIELKLLLNTNQIIKFDLIYPFLFIYIYFFIIKKTLLFSEKNYNYCVNFILTLICLINLIHICDIFGLILNNNSNFKLVLFENPNIFHVNLTSYISLFGIWVILFNQENFAKKLFKMSILISFVFIIYLNKTHGAFIFYFY